MAIGQTGVFDPRDFKNMVKEIAELNKKVEEQSKDAKIDNLIDLKQRRDLFGVSSRNLEEFKEARKGIKDQRDALEKLREEFGEGITETKRYRKIEERLKKDEIKQNRLLMTPLSARKEEAKEALATTRETFQKYLGRNSFFGKTMGSVVGIFQSIGGFLTRQTATISKILGAGLTVAALFGLANFLESETFKNMIPKIKAAIENIIKAFEEGGIIGGLKEVGKTLLDLINKGIEKSGIGDSISEGLKNMEKKVNDFFDTLFDRPDVQGGFTFIISRFMGSMLRTLGIKTPAMSKATTGKFVGRQLGETFKDEKGRLRTVARIGEKGGAITAFAEKGTKIGTLNKYPNLMSAIPFLSKILPAGTFTMMMLAMSKAESDEEKVRVLGEFIGGGLGMAKGLTVGAALGSIGIPIPFVGTALGAIGGMAIGTFAGGAIGEIIADFLINNTPIEDVVGKVSDVITKGVGFGAKVRDMTFDATTVKQAFLATGNRQLLEPPKHIGEVRRRPPTLQELKDKFGRDGEPDTRFNLNDARRGNSGANIQMMSSSDNSVKTSSTNLMMTSDNPVDVAFRNQIVLGYNVAGIA